jgi:hypothetical protein
VAKDGMAKKVPALLLTLKERNLMLKQKVQNLATCFIIFNCTPNFIIWLTQACTYSQFFTRENVP